MRRDGETGEFELVLGNAQLLSGLFIVVLLFAVFFALGYVVGQNSPRSAKLPETAATGQADRPQPVTSPQAQTPPGSAGVETPPVQPPADANSAASQEQPAAVTAQAPEATPAPAPAAEPEEAAPGSYWQVMALKQADAEVVVRSLKDKGFPATVAPGRNNLMRVLVGPYKDMAAMSKVKTELENAGFHPIKK
jgi:cell division septation protein DedD